MSTKKEYIYSTKTSKVETGKNTWDVLRVEIFRKEAEVENSPEEKIGEYTRNYHSMYNTFFAFKKNGKEYALYSKDYSTTSLMSLPDCKHIADTDSGFCPVDFFVPDFEEHFMYKQIYTESLEKARAKKNDKDFNYYIQRLKEWEGYNKLVHTRALVAGCVWGDDSGGWKVMMLDISDIENGKIKLVDELGYFQLPDSGMLLKDCVRWEEPERFNIALGVSFCIQEDNTKSGFHGYSMHSLKMYRGDRLDHFEVVKIKDEPKLL